MRIYSLIGYNSSQILSHALVKWLRMDHFFFLSSKSTNRHNPAKESWLICYVFINGLIITFLSWNIRFPVLRASKSNINSRAYDVMSSTEVSLTIEQLFIFTMCIYWSSMFFFRYLINLMRRKMVLLNLRNLSMPSVFSTLMPQLKRKSTVRNLI